VRRYRALLRRERRRRVGQRNENDAPFPCGRRLARQPASLTIATDRQAAMFSKVTGTRSSLAFAAQGSVPKQVVNVTVPLPLHGSRRLVGIALAVLYRV